MQMIIRRDNWRSDPDFILNQPAADKARILVAGDNFGCGYSREQAFCNFKGEGFQVVISTGFADNPVQTVSVELEAQTLTLPDGRSAAFAIDSFSKRCILQIIGPLGFLQSQEEHIAAYEARNAAQVETVGEVKG